MITPSQIPAGHYITATCTRPGCGEARYLTRAILLEKAGDVPLDRIGGLLRCLDRREPRGPACGGRMTIELASIGHSDTEAKGGWPTLPANGR